MRKIFLKVQIYYVEGVEAGAVFAQELIRLAKLGAISYDTKIKNCLTGEVHEARKYRQLNFLAPPAPARQTAVATQEEIVESLPMSLREAHKTATEMFYSDVKEERFVITDEYIQVRDLVEANTPVILVTGGAGTGKSALISWLRDLGLVTVVVAPTGMAAINCGGKTIHSMFQFGIGTFLDLEKDLGYIRERLKAILRNLNILVIDEISMVRADLMDAIDYRLRTVRHRESEPFGGVQVLMIGDPFQLPPVAKRDEMQFFEPGRPCQKWDCKYFFGANVFKEIGIRHVRLTKNFRQGEDLEYAEHLNRIRSGSGSINSSLAYFNDKVRKPENHTVTLTTTNQIATDRNTQKLEAIKADAVTFTAEASGSFVHATLVRSENAPKGTASTISDDSTRLPAPYELTLKVGAQVMIICNDTRAWRYVNGTTGIVTGINIIDNEIDVRTADGTEVSLTRKCWTSEKINYDASTKKIHKKSDGRYTQFPLLLSWAITIHKAQGKTLSAAHVDLGKEDAFEKGQTYVALSRVKSGNNLTLERTLTVSDIQVDPVIRRWLATEEDGYFYPR